ncbi:MAG: hypothetical protein AAB373_04860 [Patescibacteria group bacterium]
MFENFVDIVGRLLIEAGEFKKQDRLHKISDPDKEVDIILLSEDIVKILSLSGNSVTITRKALKHIVNNREINKADVDDIVGSIPYVLSCPTKIVDNSHKKINSFLFVRMNGKAKGYFREGGRSSISTSIGRCGSSLSVRRKQSFIC